jgi:hypothetical protein
MITSGTHNEVLRNPSWETLLHVMAQIAFVDMSTDFIIFNISDDSWVTLDY